MKILLLPFFLRKKFEEKGFLEELENNYGVYLNMEKDNFINEMKNKIKEIKNYNELFKFIGCEYGSNEDYIQAIMKGYKRFNTNNNKKDFKIRKK